jgi:hypothetical protein
LDKTKASWMKEVAGGARRNNVKMPLESRQLRECVLNVLAAK